MPTVLKMFGLRVVIYPNDHRPAHVHIMGNACEAVFNLNCPSGQPELRENYGFTGKELVKIVTELTTNLAILCNAWKQIHDQPNPRHR